jgi:hypothetical protein
MMCKICVAAFLKANNLSLYSAMKQIIISVFSKKEYNVDMFWQVNAANGRMLGGGGVDGGNDMFLRGVIILLITH